MPSGTGIAPINKTGEYAPLFARVLTENRIVSALNFHSPATNSKGGHWFVHGEQYRTIGRYFAQNRIPIFEFHPWVAEGTPETAAVYYRGTSFVMINRSRFFYNAEATIVHETTHILQDQRGARMQVWAAELECRFAETLLYRRLGRDVSSIIRNEADRLIAKIAKRYLADGLAYYGSADFRRKRNRAIKAIGRLGYHEWAWGKQDGLDLYEGDARLAPSSMTDVYYTG